MRLLPLLTAVILLWSCHTAPTVAIKKTFCDTTCNGDSFKFKGSGKYNPFVTISVKNCVADSLIWGHDRLAADRQMHMSTFLDRIVKLNKTAIACYIKDTSYAWLSFNDCSTGRGYLLKLPFNKKETISKISGAINSFDKKFVVPDDLRAYADYSTIYVIDAATGKKDQMTFKEEYKINWDDIHETIDSVNVSRNRIYVKLKKNGADVPLEKSINL